MATPKATRAKTTSVLGHEPPTPDQLVPGCTITSELYGILEVQDIDEDEASNDAAKRLNNTGHELQNAGYPRHITSAVIQLEWYVRDLVIMWKDRGCDERLEEYLERVGFAQAFDDRFLHGSERRGFRSCRSEACPGWRV